MSSHAYWKAPGKGETLEGNPEGKRPVVGGNTFVVVAADGGDDEHADGCCAAKACELIAANKDRSFWLGVGFVRPHVPFVSPAKYHTPYPPESMQLPEKVPGDWDDIPATGINCKTSTNMKMDVVKQYRAVGADGEGIAVAGGRRAGSGGRAEWLFRSGV